MDGGRWFGDVGNNEKGDIGKGRGREGRRRVSEGGQRCGRVARKEGR